MLSLTASLLPSSARNGLLPWSGTRETPASMASVLSTPRGGPVSRSNVKWTWPVGCKHPCQMIDCCSWVSSLSNPAPCIACNGGKLRSWLSVSPIHQQWISIPPRRMDCGSINWSPWWKHWISVPTSSWVFPDHPCTIIVLPSTAMSLVPPSPLFSLPSLSPHPPIHLFTMQAFARRRFP